MEGLDSNFKSVILLSHQNKSMWIEFPLFSIQWLFDWMKKKDKRKTFGSIENYTRLWMFYGEEQRQEIEQKCRQRISEGKTWRFSIVFLYLKKLEIKRKKRKHKNLSIHGAIDIVNREKEVQSLVPPHISRSFIANYYMDKHVCWLWTFKLF